MQSTKIFLGNAYLYQLFLAYMINGLSLIVIMCILPSILSLNSCICNNLDICVDYKCKHKDFFFPTLQEIIGVFSIFIGSAISNAGGIGGGGLLIPILILILKFQVHEAIPLSKIMIFSGALTAFVMGMKNTHPFRKATTVDYNIAGIMTPMILFGTMVGVTLNQLFPAPIILFSLTFVLVVNTYKTISKGMKEYHKENQITSQIIKELIALDIQEETDEDNDEDIDSELKTLKPKDDNQRALDRHQSKTTSVNLSDSQLDQEFQLDIKCPFRKLAEMFVSFALLKLITLLKGSDSLPSFLQFELCSFEYWGLYLSFFPISGYLTHRYSLIVMSEYNRRTEMNYPYHDSDIKWSNKIIVYYPLVGLFGGMMAGLLGIGGGLILGPILLELGIHPIVSTATSNFLVLFTSSSTSLQFALHGMLNINYGIILVIFSSFGSFFGTIVIQRLVQSTGRASFLIFALGLVLGLSTLLIPSYTFYQIFNKAEGIWSFGSVC